MTDSTRDEVIVAVILSPAGEEIRRYYFTAPLDASVELFRDGPAND